MLAGTGAPRCRVMAAVRVEAGMSSPERVLITGASGFVGANLARAELLAGKEVHLVVRAQSNLERLRDVHGRCEIHQADLRDTVALQRAVDRCRPDVVYHAAAQGTFYNQPDRIGTHQPQPIGTAAFELLTQQRPDIGAERLAWRERAGIGRVFGAWLVRLFAKPGQEVVGPLVKRAHSSGGHVQDMVRVARGEGEAGAELAVSLDQHHAGWRRTAA